MCSLFNEGDHEPHSPSSERVNRKSNCKEGEGMEEKREAHTVFYSELFERLMREKKRFIIPCFLFLLLFYFCLPLSVCFFPEQMNVASPFFAMPWGWLYAFSQFVMTFLWGWLYWRKAKHFDLLVDRIKSRSK